MSILKRKELRTMKTTAELFGENLRNQLIVKNKSQADIARYLKVTEASVSRWVNGQSMPRAKMLDRICIFLNCSVEDLTTDHSKPVEYAPEDVIAEQLKENPRLMRLMLYAMKLSDGDLDKLIEGLK